MCLLYSRKGDAKVIGLSIYFLFNIAVFANIQHNIILQQSYNVIQEKVICLWNPSPILPKCKVQIQHVTEMKLNK